MKMRNMMKNKNGQKGFTLIELIVVMAILAILAAVAIPRYTGYQAAARISADKATFGTIDSAIKTGVANGAIADGAVTATSAATTGAITSSQANLLESGASFKVTANQNKTFTWTVAGGVITKQPTIDDGTGVITNAP